MTLSVQGGLRCVQDGCPFNENSTCLEQVNPVNECPHLKKFEPTTIGDETQLNGHTKPESNVEKQLQVESIGVYPGWSLQRNQIDSVMGEAETIVVIVAGDTDSGKTTLIALTYSAFLKGAVGDWRFAGSRTLLAYEACVQNHRASQNHDVPFTPHTPLDIDEYYHLDVQSGRDLRTKRLVFHNISGERYQHAMDTTAAAETLHMVRRADIIVVMLDGTKLLKKASALHAKSRMIDLLLAIARVSYLNANQPVQILVSRWDAVVAADGVATVEASMEEIQVLATKRLAEVGVSSSVSIHGIASVTHHKETPFGYGYEGVLEVWLSRRPKAVAQVSDELDRTGRAEGWTSLALHAASPRVQVKRKQDD